MSSARGRDIHTAVPCDLVKFPKQGGVVMRVPMTGSDVCYNRQLSRRPPAPVSVETEAPTSPATRAVADVRNAPPLLKRRGRRTPTRARCVVGSSHCLVCLWPLSKLQSVELAVRVVQPARAGSGMMSRQKRTTKVAEGGRYIMRFRTMQNVFLHLVCH